MSAGAIAAAALKRQREEEERRTEYSMQHLEGDYEFKILRSLTGAFRRQSVMEKALREEALSGWTLIEKFDSSRLRLYRHRHYKQTTPSGIDPYRTQYGLRTSTFVMLMLLVAMIPPSVVFFANGEKSHKSERRLIINGVDYGLLNLSDKVDPWPNPPLVNGEPRQPISTQEAEQAAPSNR